jgi:hypothetical protein
MQQHGEFLVFFCHGKRCIDLSPGKIQQLMPTLKHLIYTKVIVNYYILDETSN